MVGDPQTGQTKAPPPVAGSGKDASATALTDAHYDLINQLCGVDLRDPANQSIDPNVGKPNQSVDPNAGKPAQSVSPKAPPADRSAKPEPNEPLAGAPPLAPAEAVLGAPVVLATSKDKYRGVVVSKVTISLARKRAGFQTPLGVMLGDVDTDLQPGEYTLQPNLPQQKWVITGPGVTSGLRFSVTLKDADPWILTYPNTLPLSVSAGSDKEPTTFGDSKDASGKQKDPLWLFEGMPLQEPVSGPDDFEDVHYDLDYRSDKGNLSKFLQVNYRDRSHKDINLDTVGKETPRLFAAKQDALKIMDDYNTNFILGSFPTVFFIITINPFVAPIEGGPPARYSATRRSAPKNAPPSETTEPGAPAKPSEPGGVAKPAEPGAALQSAEPLKPDVGIKMYGEAVKRVKSMPPGERVGKFKAYVDDIKVSTKGQWSAKSSKLADGGTMFSGEGGEALVFDPQGNMFRGSTSNMTGPNAQFSFGEGGALMPNYKNLQPR